MAPYNRDQALDAAMSLFWSKGYHATSLKDLEQVLNMRPGSIYAAFSSKSNLYLLALERYFEAVKETFEGMASAPGSPLELLSDQLRKFADIPTDDEQAQACMLIKTLIDTRSTNLDISSRAKLYIDETRKLIAAIFEKAKQKGELPETADCDRLARRYQAAISSIRFEWHKGSDPRKVLNLAEDLAQGFENLRRG